MALRLHSRRQVPEGEGIRKSTEVTPKMPFAPNVFFAVTLHPTSLTATLAPPIYLYGTFGISPF